MVAGDFRKGVTIEIDGKVFMVVDFQHVKPGKGAAFVRAKLKNVVTGQVLEQTFNPSDKYPDARIERKEMQYSYNDGDLYYFMDMETFDMLPLNFEMVEDAMQFVKEEMMVTIQLYKGEAFSVVPPNFVELEVASTEPGIQGDLRPATSPLRWKPDTIFRCPCLSIRAIKSASIPVPEHIWSALNS